MAGAQSIKIKVFGVGTSGSNAVELMARGKLDFAELYAVDTSTAALEHNIARDMIREILISPKSNTCIGEVDDPKIGIMAGEEGREELNKAVMGAHMVFVVTGMGGSTGTRVAPVVAKLARDSGAFVIGAVTLPFAFEGSQRLDRARKGVERLQPTCNNMIVVPSDLIVLSLFSLCDRRTAAQGAFRLADHVLHQAVSAICSVIIGQTEINLEFADLKAVMEGMGQGLLSIATASGRDRAVEAAKACINSPMLHTPIWKANAILFSISGAIDLTLRDIQRAIDVIRNAADSSANVIFGLTYAPEMLNEIRITLITAGFSPDRGGGSRQAIQKQLNKLHEWEAIV